MKIKGFRAARILIALTAAASAGTSIAEGFGTPLTYPTTIASLDHLPTYTAVARDGQRNFAMLWFPLGGSSAMVEKFGADGAPLTAAIPVTGLSAGPRSLAMDNAGDFVVAGRCAPWYKNGVAALTICAQVYAPDGTPSGPLITVAEYARGSGEGTGLNGLIIGDYQDQQKGVRVSMSASGDFVVAWAGQVYFGLVPNGLNDVVSSNFVQLRRYHLNGIPYGDAVYVDQQSFPVIEPQTPLITGLDMNAAGSFAITWNRLYPSADSQCLARFYAADGTPTSAEIAEPLSIIVKTGVRLEAVNCSDSIAVEDNGDVVFVWETLNSTSTPTTETDYLGRYSPLGLPKTMPKPILTRSYTSGVQGDWGFGGLTVGATSNNGSVLTWGVFGNINSGMVPMTFYGQAFDSKEVPLGGAVTLGMSTAPLGGQPVDPGILTSVLDTNDDLVVGYGLFMAQRFQGPVPLLR